MVLTTHLLVLGCESVGAMPLPVPVQSYHKVTFSFLKSLKLLSGNTNSEMWSAILSKRSVPYL